MNEDGKRVLGKIAPQVPGLPKMLDASGEISISFFSRSDILEFDVLCVFLF